MVLGIVEGAALGQMLRARRELAEVLKRLAERPVGLDEQGRVPDALGQAEEPLPQLARRLVLGPDEIELPQPHSATKSCGVSPTCRQR